MSLGTPKFFKRKIIAFRALSVAASGGFTYGGKSSPVWSERCAERGGVCGLGTGAPAEVNGGVDGRGGSWVDDSVGSWGLAVADSPSRNRCRMCLNLRMCWEATRRSGARLPSLPRICCFGAEMQAWKHISARRMLPAMIRGSERLATWYRQRSRASRKSAFRMSISKTQLERWSKLDVALDPLSPRFFAPPPSTHSTAVSFIFASAACFCLSSSSRCCSQKDALALPRCALSISRRDFMARAPC